MKPSKGRKRNTPTLTSLPDVRVLLSRPAYPLGGSIVGTVLIQRHKQHGNESGDGETDNGDCNGTAKSLKSLLESVTVYIAGFCKIDARWHDFTNYTDIYGKTHPYIDPLRQRFGVDLLEQNEDTVCFWATNGVEALDLPERGDGRRWRINEMDFRNDENHSNINIFAFTFRADIPEDLPHSVHATTCRYFYTANVLVKTVTKQQILKKNFLVYDSASTSNGNGQTQNNLSRASARVKLGSCVGLAHSNGLPCHLSVTEIHRPKGQIMVVQNHCLVSRQSHDDIQTLRVSNASGHPVCVLTLIGSQCLCPGSCIHLQWDFPTISQIQNGNSQLSDNWIPCHQVCACLKGEEFAIYEDGSKKRTQTFLFDTCQEWVDPGVTNRVSKTLWLSSGNAANDGNTSSSGGGAPPCDLETDIMGVSTWCQVDITVRDRTTAGGYNNLSLQIPCRVRLGSRLNTEQEELDRMDQQVQPLNELLNIETENFVFPTNDIRADLKTLSLRMEELVCNEDLMPPNNKNE